MLLIISEIINATGQLQIYI